MPVPGRIADPAAGCVTAVLIFKLPLEKQDLLSIGALIGWQGPAGFEPLQIDHLVTCLRVERQSRMSGSIAALPGA